MDKKCFLLAILFVSTLFNFSSGLRILLIVPGMSDSHLMFNYKFAHMLQNAGHNVTLLTMVMSLGQLSDPHPPKGIEEFRTGIKSEAEGEGLTTSFQDSVFQPSTLKHTATIIQGFVKRSAEACRSVTDEDELLENLSRLKFDVVFSHFISLCPVGIAHKINVKKTIWLVPGTWILIKAAQCLSLPSFASYIPDTSADFSDQMTFLHRTKNFLIQTVDNVLSNLPIFPDFDEAKAFQKFPNEDFPHLDDLASDVQALLINGEDFLDFPRPLFTNTLHIGDLWHKHPKHLNEEWQNFMDNSNDGVILFSLGTIANTTLMPIEMKNAFLEALSSFSTYSIIWRLEGEMPKGIEKLKNLKVVKWIPQKELLAHPKLKLFITHGGYNSLLETAQAAVPMILIPLFGDQHGNARRAERYGLGLTLDKLSPDAKHITETIRKVLTEEKFRLNVNKFSSMLQDKIIPSENFTLHIINKIVHSTNWPTPKAAKKLNYFQYFCLDVISLFLIVLLLLCSILWKIFLCIYSLLNRRAKRYI